MLTFLRLYALKSFERRDEKKNLFCFGFEIGTHCVSPATRELLML